MAFDARGFFTRLINAMASAERGTLEQLVHPEYVGDFPQTGERVHGFAGFWAQIEQYPGGAPGAVLSPRVIGDEERWAISPNYIVVPLASSNEFTVVGRVPYPDGTTWHVVQVVELRDERLYRTESYFAPELTAPLPESVAAYGSQ